MKFKNKIQLSLFILVFCGTCLTGCSASSIERALSGLSNGSSDSSSTEAEESSDGTASSEYGSSVSGSSAEGFFSSLFENHSSDSDSASGPGSFGDAVEPTEGLSGFAHDQISAEAQDVYASLYTGIMSHKSVFTVRADSSDDIKTALRAIMTDHPEFFWLTGASRMSGYESLGIWQVSLSFNVEPSEIDGISDTIESKVQSFLASVPEDATNYTRVRMAYEYVISNTDYDSSSDQNQNIQSVFLNGRSVCAGYAKAFQYLCHRMSIPCIYVEGSVDKDGNSEGHAWNIVEIDGVYTNVDPSWGDPTYGEDQTDSKRLGIIYDDLCLTTAEMTRNHHTESSTWTYPECTDRTYDYYILNGYYHNGYDADTISSVLWNAVNEGDSVVLMKFSDFDSYAQAMAALFPSDGSGSLLEAPLQQRMEWDSTRSMRYYYSYSDELLIIKIYW